MRETDPVTDQILKYRAVETPDRETTIREFTQRFYGEHNLPALSSLLALHNELRLGNQLYLFSGDIDLVSIGVDNG